MKKTKTTTEPEGKLNVWKVTGAILLVGALCWLAFSLFGCATSFGKGDIDQRVIVLGRDNEPAKPE
jgi:hypothetical protein